MATAGGPNIVMVLGKDCARADKYAIAERSHRAVFQKPPSS
jgi:hypothetical protein